MQQRDLQAIRQFNRDYVLILGILNRNMKNLPYSLTEGRILFEIDAGTVVANQLAKKLNLDRSYLNRIIQNLFKQELIAKSDSDEDSRIKVLSITPAGQAAIQEINQENDLMTAELFASFSPPELKQIITSMHLISQKLL